MNYTALAARTEKMIARYGKPLTLRSYSAATYDPATMTYTAGSAVDVSAVGVEEQYRAEHVDGTLIKAGDVKFMVSSSVEPTTSMKLISGLVEWNIISVQAIKPADTALYYVIQARK